MRDRPDGKRVVKTIRAMHATPPTSPWRSCATARRPEVRQNGPLCEDAARAPMKAAAK